MNVTMDRDLVNWLSDEPNSSQIVDKAVRKYYNRYIVGVYESKQDVEEALEDTKKEIEKYDDLLVRLHKDQNNLVKLLGVMSNDKEHKIE